ncbi:MAG: hypothetical protein HYU66_13325 [Armatimonadetes bacterium]|nr:hypothetical protein [Armatimonadota bacterium]
MHVTVAGCEFEIAHGPVPSGLAGTTARGVLWQAAPGELWIEVPDVARYLVSRGTTVAIDAVTDDPAEIDRFLRLTPLAALFHQRGILAFHAAAAADERGAVLLAGSSGAGKSTLLMALLQRGWTALADELAVVRFDAQGNPWVWPMSAEVTLWAEAAERLGVEAAGSNGCRGGAKRIEAINLAVYQTHIADALRDPVTHFANAARLAAAVPIQRLSRPRGQWSVDVLAELLAGGRR